MCVLQYYAIGYARAGSHSGRDGMDAGLLSENQAQDEARPVQRAGQTVSGLLLSAAGPAALHRASKQVLHPP